MLAFSSVLIFALFAVPMAFIGLVVFLATRRRRGRSPAAAPPPPAALAPAPAVRKQLEQIRQADPDFSVVLLEDFLYALYAEAQAARGQRATGRLAPYLGPAARETLDGLGPTPVSGVVVGAMRFVGFCAGARLDLAVEFEANYAETHGAAVRGFYALERWHLVRNPAARSRPPDRVRVLGCPCCGAPLDRLVGATCQYCNRVVDGGSYDWTVDRIEILERTERGPMLTGTVEEQGTNLPTVFDPALAQGLQYLHQKDSGFQEQALMGRVALVFQTLQQAWSTLQWPLAQPFLSDNLFEAQSYWIRAYQAQGLRNVTERPRITNLEIVRITADKWYDAVTLRVHATGLDYTIRVADNAVVGGDRQRERVYTEYWTLIRGSGRTGATRTDAACPNCGAPLQVNMTAVCGYCQAKVNSGAFDWVLSRIEQDDVYVG
jgi:predicted lipid-binding transport protein (Tim44 family)